MKSYNIFNSKFLSTYFILSLQRFPCNERGYRHPLIIISRVERNLCSIVVGMNNSLRIANLKTKVKSSVSYRSRQQLNDTLPNIADIIFPQSRNSRVLYLRNSRD